MKRLQKSYKDQDKIKYLFPAAALFFIFAAVLGVASGSVRLDIAHLFEGSNLQILLYVRLPRTLACLVSGAALAVSGCIIQSVLANRLASPSLIGVNSGAGLAVTVCTALGIYGGTQMALSSFLGAFISVSVIALGSKKWGRSRSTVILAGVALNSLLNAVSSAIITVSPNVGVLSNDFKVGDFSSVTYQKLIPASIGIFVALTVVLTLSNELDIMGLGEDTARGLGLNTGKMRIIFLLLAALLAGCAVSIAGLLSFVGLIIPNAIRKMTGNRSKHMLPLSILFGGSFVSVCDTLARSLFSPYEIPVGIIMAFIGAPFFIFLLIKSKGGTK